MSSPALPPAEKIADKAFGPVAYETWRAAVQADLKDVSFEKKLVARTYEGVDLQPLYSLGESTAPESFPTATTLRTASSRCSVGTDTPMRFAHVFNDSLRRKRATARSAPSFSMAAAVAGGRCRRARAVFGIYIEYSKIGACINIYICKKT